jgi:anti-anti-sigma factor
MTVDDRVIVHRSFDHALIVLTGDLDILESEMLDELAVSLFSQLTATVDIDMTGVTFLGSRALAAVLNLRTEVARHSGAEMRISKFNEQVRRIFELTGVLDMLALGPALAEPALAPATMSEVA